MKIVYNQYTPLDGAGTILSPAYKWRVDERTEFCRNISQAGNLFYLMSYGGYVIHSVDAEKIKRIEVGDLVVTIKYNHFDKYPFQASYDKVDGTHIQNHGCKEFGSILDEIRQLSN
jgi:hypothetical protein